MRETDKEFVLNLLRGIAARNGGAYKERVLRGIQQIEDEINEGEAWRVTVLAMEADVHAQHQMSLEEDATMQHQQEAPL